MNRIYLNYMLFGAIFILMGFSLPLYPQSIPTVKEMTIAVLYITPYSNKFCDKRDNRLYHQVKIGNQIWMAENLSYGKLVMDMDQKDNAVIEKSYYQNDSVIGRKYGALYSWEEAMQYHSSEMDDIIKGICPDGWHLPSDQEWNILTEYLDKKVQKGETGWIGSNIALLLIDSSQAKFATKLGGNAVSNWFFYLNEMGYFWTSTKYSNASAYYRSISRDSKQIYRGAGDKKLGMSIRCIKD